MRWLILLLSQLGESFGRCQLGSGPDSGSLVETEAGVAAIDSGPGVASTGALGPAMIRGPNPPSARLPLLLLPSDDYADHSRPNRIIGRVRVRHDARVPVTWVKVKRLIQVLRDSSETTVCLL